MNKDINNWYAIRTHKDFEARRVLSEYCDDVFLPTEEVKIPSTGRTRTRAVIPHVLFIKTTPSEALSLEKRGRDINDRMIQFWIYRYQKEGEIQKITEEEIRLIKLLTSNDTAKCEVFNKEGFQKGQHVRITGGQFAGYTGYVQRVKKNMHVVVEIQGICAVMLPFIHPDLLEIIDD